jgi:hypothetical protein
MPSSEEIYTQLQKVTEWRRNGGSDKTNFAKSCAEMSSKMSTPTKGDVFCASQRGRAIWFPDLFTQNDRTLHSLACYHRNLVLASMQVESLGLLILATAKQRQNGEDFYSPDHRECARRAADILGRLHKGSYSTYRSYSSRVQIEENNVKEPLTKIRSFFDMPPLAS